MSPRSVRLVLLLPAFLLGGCGTVSQVRTAFEMPVDPTPSPQELARARRTRATNSLSESLAKLDSQIIGRYFSSGSQSTVSPTPTQAPRPVGMDARPALALANDLSRAQDIPVAPRQIAVSLATGGVSSPPAIPSASATATVFLASRVVETSPFKTNGSNQALSEFLQTWASRNSLRRADDELLRQRALEDRIALQTRTARPTLDLSLVSPETQLELTNLRLKLIPLLSVPAAQRLQAKQEIEAIEARLNRIWEEETARQSALLRQALVDVPARLRQEGDKVIELDTRLDAERTNARLAQVRASTQQNLGDITIPALDIVQRGSIAPDAARVRTSVGAVVVAQSGGTSPRPMPLPGVAGISRRQPGRLGNAAQNMAERTDRIWREATR